MVRNGKGAHSGWFGGMCVGGGCSGLGANVTSFNKRECADEQSAQADLGACGHVVAGLFWVAALTSVFAVERGTQACLGHVRGVAAVVLRALTSVCVCCQTECTCWFWGRVDRWLPIYYGWRLRQA